MNSFTLALNSIRSRPLHSVLCMSAVAAGITLLSAVFLFSQSVSSGFAKNAKGIDMVVGAKGSPLQLILSSVYHADIPAGNITIADYKKLKSDPNIRQAIPIALGDSYKGFRMVGTIPEYLKIYNGKLKEGRVFKENFETVAGSDTGMKIGQKIAVTHGFSANSVDIHDDNLYTITGILKPTGTVLDKLLVTHYKNIQNLHANHDHHEEENNKDEHHEDEHDEHHKDKHEIHEEQHTESLSEHGNDKDLGNQITSIFLKVRSPIDLMNMPRKINQSSYVMAAVPSYEISRFTKSLGIGRQLIVFLGIIFVILSSLMLWATLSSSLALRRYDLALLRVLGAPPHRLFNTVMIEAMLISGIGALIGIILGHLVAYYTIISVDSLRGFTMPNTVLKPNSMDIWFIALCLFSGLLASLIPSISAARTDIAKLLSRGSV